MFQLYIIRLKCLFRSKEDMFWSYMFPLLLATCFFFAFNNLWDIESFKTITIAYDNEGVKEDEFGQILREARMNDGTVMFDITYCGKEKAKMLLEEGDIEAYIVGSKVPVLYVKENGLNETIVKSFIDSYRQRAVTVQTILQKNPDAVHEGLIEDIMQYDTFVEEVMNEKNPDYILIYFYSLMAYACICAANWGLEEVINIQADQSERGARMNAAPIHKMKLFLCNLLAAFTAHIGSIFLLFFYMYYFMKINFGDNLLYLILICIIGSLAGMTMGAAVGVWIKKKPSVKQAILTGITLACGFLSGMMSVDIKYIIAEKVPFLAYINPVNLMTDAMYSLYYYDTYEHFYMYSVILCVVTVIFCIASYIGIRRGNYASI